MKKYLLLLQEEFNLNNKMGNFCLGNHSREMRSKSQNNVIQPIRPRTFQSQEYDENGSHQKLIRLPKVVEVPLRYELVIVPCIEELKAQCEVIVSLKILDEDVEALYFHAADLAIEHIFIVEEGAETGLKGIFYEASEYIGQTIAVKFLDPDHAFKANTRYQIKFDYEIRIVTNSNTKFYLTVNQAFLLGRYPELSVPQICQLVSTAENREEILGQIQLSTQFAPNFARFFLPCFDEPYFKAQFKLSVVSRYPELNIISNCDVDFTEEREGDAFLVQFQETPAISTYLLALVMGDFETIEKSCKDVDYTVRIHTRPGESKKALDMLDIAADALDFCSSFFQLPYNQNKLDIVSLNQHQFGAMENQACITVKEGTLESPISRSSLTDFTNNAMTVVHEISHMWFGNLVTCEWWSDVWLNEGFGKFFEFFILHKIRPKLPSRGIFIDSVFTQSLSSKEKQPRSLVMKDICSVDLMFVYGSITYKKGGILCWMIFQMLGETKFQECLVRYLQRFKGGNASSEMFLEVLEEITGKETGEVLRTWMHNLNYPKVLVQRNGNEFRLMQENVGVNYQDLFWIPIRIISQKRIVFQYLMKTAEAKFTIPNLTDDDAVFFNQNFQFLAKIIQSEQESKALLDNISNFDPVDRLGIIMQCAEPSVVHDPSFFKTLTFETDFSVNKKLSASIGKYLEFNYGTHSRWLEALQNIIVYLKPLLLEDLKELKRQANWSKGKGSQAGPNFSKLELIISRIFIVGFVAKDEEVCQNLVMLLQKLEAGKYSTPISNFPPELRSVIYMTVASTNIQGGQILVKKLVPLEKKNQVIGTIEMQYLRAALLLSSNKVFPFQKFNDIVVYLPLLGVWPKKCFMIVAAQSLEVRFKDIGEMDRKMLCLLLSQILNFFYDGGQNLSLITSHFEPDIPTFKFFSTVLSDPTIKRGIIEMNQSTAPQIADFITRY